MEGGESFWREGDEEEVILEGGGGRGKSFWKGGGVLSSGQQ